MRASDFDYVLPEELIAQEPSPERDASRLLLVRRSAGTWTDHEFAGLPNLLPPGALLVMNDSRVFPARLRGCKASGGAVEVLLVRREGGRERGREERGQERYLWSVLCRSSKGLKPGQELFFESPGAGPRVTAAVEEIGSEGTAMLAFHLPEAWRWGSDGGVNADAGAGSGARAGVEAGAGADAGAGAQAGADPFFRWVQAVGETPLPPYIRRPEGERPFDRERYQTVYARPLGSVAAPTAGLHFTEALLASLDAKGFGRAMVTLHVGPGTFRPVRAEQIEEHRMDEEVVEISEATVAALRDARASGRPIVAVGTTTVRALEAAAARPGGLAAGRFATELFIRPGHVFAWVDGLVTNFHLPRSTLLMLVAALVGRETALAAYGHAVSSRYRFYSYGDAMLVV